MNTSAPPIYLHYKLWLRSPAIVSTVSGDPSSVATQPFIPGSVLRGALASRLLANGIAGDSAEFRRLILSGDVRYLHAYPELAGERALPVAPSWRSRKGDPGRVIDLAAFSGAIDVSADAEDFEAVWPEEALVSVPGLFAAAISGGVRHITTPLIGSRIHQQRDRVKGRPWKDSNEQTYGALFAYEYLEPNQVFRGVIQFMPAAMGDIERVKQLLGIAPILVGRSRRAGYGGEAVVDFTEQSQREYENVSGSISRDIAVGDAFRAFLVSACVCRHPTTGQIDPAALPDALRHRLGDAVDVQRTRWTFETLGAFNRKWRLEIPQTLAIGAGAVLVLKATAAIPAATLRAIEHEGLGERRVEGYGRVLFLAHSEDHRPIRIQRANERPRLEGDDHREHGRPFDQHGGPLDLLERRIVLAAARAELDRVASRDLATHAKQLPTNSLLGRLRTLFRRVTDEETARAALANVRIWCSDDDAPGVLKKNAREKLDRCSINGRSFHRWLRQLADAEHGERGWKALVQASGNPATLTGLAARSHLRSPEAAETVLYSHSALLRVHLIDAVFSAMARLNRRGVT